VKSSNNPADIDRDLRDAIITDLRCNAKKELQNVSGILISGDIAFSGSEVEYANAKTYLNDISDIFSIKPSDIYCVPGNHDVDRMIAASSVTVSQAQRTIDEFPSMDMADEAFAKFINDCYDNSVLFEPLRKYNEFANRFNCNISAEQITWSKDFELEHGLKLCLVGINSCYVPNNIHGLMYIGQAQIPRRMSDTAVMLMCHHPPECWKFGEEIIDRINKRADIQLYGHMHMQSTKLDDNNTILFSGAAHPQRVEDWLPRYNWISIGSEMQNGDRILNIEIYPRVLSKNRDRFQVDEFGTTDGISLRHTINIDKKRRLDLEDTCFEYDSSTDLRVESTVTSIVKKEIKVNSIEVDERELIYNFYELSSIRQMEVLEKLKLISENDRKNSIATILNNSIQLAKEQGKIQLFYDYVNGYVLQKDGIK
jgi:predicted phosphodiesterase